jgi:Mrp family chromosome partitioning ATPase
VGLLDADIYGPNVPSMMGMTRPPNMVAEDRIGPLTAHGVKFISIGPACARRQTHGDARAHVAPDHPPIPTAG